MFILLDKEAFAHFKAITFDDKDPSQDIDQERSVLKPVGDVPSDCLSYIVTCFVSRKPSKIPFVAIRPLNL